MIRFVWISAAVAAACCAGCGPHNVPVFEKTAPVRGSVVLANGTTLTGGRVTFHPRDPSKSEARGMIGGNGRFEMGTYKTTDGVMPGAYTVTVEPIVYDRNGNLRPVRAGVPKKYAEPSTSDLTVEIGEEGNENLKLVLR